jgi:hypothetical protein
LLDPGRISVTFDHRVRCDRGALLTSAASSGVAYSREGGYAVAPLPGDAAVISDGVTTQRLDAAEELGDGGRVVIGPSGRIWWNLSSKFPVIVGFPYLLVTR